MANPASQPNAKEYVDKTITEQDKRHADLFQTFVAYTRRTSKTCDNGEQVANIVRAVAENEKYDMTTKVALTDVATQLANAELYRDNHVQALENHVLAELANYGNRHRGSQPDLRRSLNQSQRRSKQAEQQTEAGKQFTRQLVKFESDRVSGLKTVLENFLFSELAWHVKAAEIYSTAFKILQGINEHDDVEDFRRSLQLPEADTGTLRPDRHRGQYNTLG